MKTEIEVWHDHDHRIYTYHWDPKIGRYVQQPGPGRPRDYGARAEQSRRELTRLLEQIR